MSERSDVGGDLGAMRCSISTRSQQNKASDLLLSLSSLVVLSLRLQEQVSVVFCMIQSGILTRIACVDVVRINVYLGVALRSQHLTRQ